MGSIKVAGVAHALDITEQTEQEKKEDVCYFSYCSTSAQLGLQAESSSSAPCGL